MLKEIGNSYVLVGIVSWGPENCASPVVPGVYVNITEYMDWIKENMENVDKTEVVCNKSNSVTEKLTRLFQIGSVVA